MHTTASNHPFRLLLVLFVTMTLIAGGSKVDAFDRGVSTPADPTATVSLLPTPRATEVPPTTAPRPTIAPVTQPPRATEVPLTETPVPTQLPTTPTPTVPVSTPPVIDQFPQVPAPLSGKVVTYGRICSETFYTKGGGSAFQYVSYCTDLPYETWHYAESGTTHTTGSPVLRMYDGQGKSFPLKAGSALAAVYTVEGLTLMAVTCQSPSQPLTKMPTKYLTAITIAPQQTTSCTWYFKPTTTPATVNVAIWQCADGFVLDDYEEMITSCTTPVDGISARLLDQSDKDFDYEATTVGGAISFTQVIPESYVVYLFPGSFQPPLAPGTEILGSCKPDVYQAVSLTSPKIGWFTPVSGGVVTCNVWIMPPA